MRALSQLPGQKVAFAQFYSVLRYQFYSSCPEFTTFYRISGLFYQKKSHNSLIVNELCDSGKTLFINMHYTETPYSLKASFKDTFLSVLGVRFPIIKAHDT